MTRARDIADTQDNVGGVLPPFTAGKNKIINGDFGIWQRGTSFSNSNGVYTADRFLIGNSTAVPTSTASQQTFTAGTAPVAGYEGTYFFRLNVSNQGSSTGQQIITRLEDVRLFANQTVTFSFWAKADASRTLGDVKIGQNFGSGGSGAVETTVTLNSTSLTTSWARYSGTVTLPSVSGKTIGTSSYLYVFITPPTTTYTLDTWGWQLEAGSVATPFTTATGTLAGELAACQRYYFRFNSNANEVLIPAGFANSTTTASGRIQFPVVMRVAPTSLDSANLRFGNYVGSNFDMSSVAYNQASTIAAQVYGTVTGATAGHVGAILGSASNAYVGLSAEL